MSVQAIVLPHSKRYPCVLPVQFRRSAGGVEKIFDCNECIGITIGWRTPAGTTRQSGRLLLGRPGWRGKTDSHAAGDRLAPRRATGGDVNDPNWTCCSISVADSNQSVLVAAPPGLRC